MSMGWLQQHRNPKVANSAPLLQRPAAHWTQPMPTQKRPDCLYAANGMLLPDCSICWCSNTKLVRKPVCCYFTPVLQEWSIVIARQQPETVHFCGSPSWDATSLLTLLVHRIQGYTRYIFNEPPLNVRVYVTLLQRLLPRGHCCVLARYKYDWILWQSCQIYLCY